MNLKWLSIDQGVMLSPAIKRAAECMDKFFEGEPSVITSGLRSPEKQLAIIVQKALRHKIEKEYPEFALHVNPDPTVQVPILDKTYYFWQRTWSRLLQIKDIVNPPIP